MQLPMPIAAEESASQVVHINARAQLHAEGDLYAVVVSGIPLLSWAGGDQISRSYAMVLLVRNGLAKPSEVAAAFGVTRVTVFRAGRAFDAEGIAGLVPGKPGPRGRRVFKEAVVKQVVLLTKQGHGPTFIAQRLGVSESGVRNACREAGIAPKTGKQAQLMRSAAEAPSVEAERTADASPAIEVVEPVRDLLEQPSHDAATAAEPASTESGVDAWSAEGPEFSPGLPATSQAGTESCSEASSESSATASGQAGPVRQGDPWDRSADRFMARIGLLSEAPPQFGRCENVLGLGALLAMPALVSSGLFEVAAKLYAGRAAAFYGVRSCFACLALMALLRIRRPEQLRHKSPPDLGRLLGLDRAPEVKTLRERLDLFSAQGCSERFQQELVRRRVEAQSEAMGFLYVDGHVRVYNGKQVKLTKAHVTRMRLSMPATVDHWVNDRDGDPLFVVTATPTGSLAKELPAVLKEVRAALGERRATVVFDRGGWSPKLFAQMLEANFDLITYRKGARTEVSPDEFSLHEGHFDGRKIAYQLAEQTLKLNYKGGSLTLREVVRLSEDGKHQTSIVTNRKDLTPVEIAYRMFERWRQENFFKYMRDQFALDALVSYAIESDDPLRDVPNPKRKELEREVKAARHEVARLERAFGEAAADNKEASRPTMRGFKIANAAIGKELKAARARVEELRAQMLAQPRRMTAQEAAGEPPARLLREVKRLTDCVKMVAYQAESALVGLVTPFYSRHADEGRSLIASAMQLSGAMEVTKGELRVTLKPASTPSRTKAISALCDELNATETLYPGTRLRMRYAIQEA